MAKANSQAGSRSPTSAIPEWPTTWPDEWPQDMRAAYYAACTSETYPGEEKQEAAWKRLTAKILQQATTATLQINPDKTAACIGVAYDSALRYCTQDCVKMPLCRAICALRPELRAQAEEHDKSMMQKHSKPRRASKKADAKAWRWVGARDAWLARQQPPGLQRVFEWMMQRKRFVASDVVVLLRRAKVKEPEKKSAAMLAALAKAKAIEARD